LRIALALLASLLSVASICATFVDDDGDDSPDGAVSAVAPLQLAADDDFVPSDAVAPPALAIESGRDPLIPPLTRVMLPPARPPIRSLLTLSCRRNR